MNLAAINDGITLRSNAGVADYTYKMRTEALNEWNETIHEWILQSQDEWDFDDSNKTDFPILTTSSVASQQDYSLPDGTINIKRVEISYDGVNWNKAEPIDVSQLSGGTSTTQIASSFSESSPRYDIQGNSVLLFPIPQSSISGGIKIWTGRNMSDFSYTDESNNDILTGTKTPGFDKQFHQILVLGPSYNWNDARKGDKSLMNQIMLIKADVQKHYGKKQADRIMSFGSAFVDYE